MNVIVMLDGNSLVKRKACELGSKFTYDNNKSVKYITDMATIYGLPLAAIDKSNNIYVAEEMADNDYIVGHEVGHIVSRVKNLKLDELAKEIYADTYSINNFCNHDSSLCLKTLGNIFTKCINLIDRDEEYFRAIAASILTRYYVIQNQREEKTC